MKFDVMVIAIAMNSRWEIHVEPTLELSTFQWQLCHDKGLGSMCYIAD